MALILINIAWKYPKCLIPIGRITLADARAGTAYTFTEALDDMGMEEGKEYRSVGLQGGSTMKIIFDNGSVIQFTPMDKTKDRDWRKVRSVPATCVGFDEVDTIEYDGFVALSSRAGRRNRPNEEGVSAPDITISTCNPNETWVKEHVYLPWKAGTLPDDMAVIEFKMQDSFQYSEGYYDGYKTNPMQWQQRFLYNNWDYMDDENSLFKSKVLDSIHTPNYNDSAQKALGVDHARQGKDRTPFAEIVGDTLVNLQVYDRDSLIRLAKPEEKENPPWSHIIGREVVRYSDARSIGWQNTGIDALPSGVVDFMRSIGRPVFEYMPGARSQPRKPTAEEERKGIKPKPSYDNIRSEGAYLLSQDMEQGKFFFYDGCPHLAELKQELLWHGFETKDKQFCVEKKDKIKERLGKSPDLADALFIAYWMKKKGIGSPGTYGSSQTNSKEDRPVTAGLLDMDF